MVDLWVPRILRPDFTWPRKMKPTIAKVTPTMPPIPCSLERRIRGIIHRLLWDFSVYCYSPLFNIAYNTKTADLPFGLVLKYIPQWGTEELAAMQLAWAAGMPVPKVISFGEENLPICDITGFSILMTRLPGGAPDRPTREWEADAEGPWLHELKECLDSMRLWQQPEERICSAIGTSIHSERVPEYHIGPFETERKLNGFLITRPGTTRFSVEERAELMARAEKIQKRPHRFTFTHGDLEPNNLLVDDNGHLTGILDWSCAGWYSDYWDFTTAMQSCPTEAKGWRQTAEWLGGNRYLEELDSERALAKLTHNSNRRQSFTSPSPPLDGTDPLNERRETRKLVCMFMTSFTVALVFHYIIWKGGQEGSDWVKRLLGRML